MKERGLIKKTLTVNPEEMKLIKADATMREAVSSFSLLQDGHWEAVFSGRKGLEKFRMLINGLVLERNFSIPPQDVFAAQIDFQTAEEIT